VPREPPERVLREPELRVPPDRVLCEVPLERVPLGREPPVPPRETGALFAPGFEAELREDDVPLDTELREDALRVDAGFFAAVLRVDAPREAGFDAALRDDALRAAVLRDAVLRDVLREAGFVAACAAGFAAPAPAPGIRFSSSSASDRSSAAADFAAFCSFLPASSPTSLSAFATCLRSPAACRRLKRSASPFLAMGSPLSSL
jgi:hypothetical protein